jgi:hypothetical protein
VTRSQASDNGFASEKFFTNWALKEARKRGWTAWHLDNMKVVRKPDGNVAIPNRDADGFPDLVLAHPEHGFVMGELKMPGRKPDEKQIVSLLALRAADVRVYIWWPRDIDEIIDVLDGRGPAQTSLIPEPAMSAS